MYQTSKHNLLNKWGQISRCIVCNSKIYWADKCPHKNEKKIAFLVENSDTDKVDDTEGVNIVLTTDKFHKAEIFVVKYLNLPAQ